MSAVTPLKQFAAWIFMQSQAPRLQASVILRGRAILLAYHRVNDEGDPFFPSLPRRAFTAQLDHLASCYRVEPLDEVVEWLQDGAKGPARVAITIDDGYPDTVGVVVPELERRGLPATLFLSTAPPETGEPLWIDRVRWLVKNASVRLLRTPWAGLEQLSMEGTAARLAALGALLPFLKTLPRAQVEAAVGLLEAGLGADGPPRPSIGWVDVRRLAGSPIRLGAHTHRHFVLSRLEDAEQEDEVATSVRLLEQRAGARVVSFAYPNGTPPDYDARTIALLRRLKLRCAVTTRPGLARAGEDPFQLPRLHTNAPSVAVFAARMAGLWATERRESRIA